MADFYVSSANYTATPQWAASAAYTVGQFVRSLAAPSQPYMYYVHRCTTAGTTAASEPAWTQGIGGTTSSGSAVFTNVTGQSTYGWSAAAGTIYTYANIGSNGRVAGDRIFVASNHSETVAGPNYSFGGSGFGVVQLTSVNSAGSVPPVAADEQSGATINVSSSGLTFDALCEVFWQGVVINNNGISWTFNGSGLKTSYFKNCAFVITNTGAFKLSNNNPAKVILENTTIQFNSTGQGIACSGYAFEFVWLNTPAAVQGSVIPTTLFTTASTPLALYTCRGVDLSAVTTTLTTSTFGGGFRCLLDSCRIAPGVARFATSNQIDNDDTELVNCYDGTNILNERYHSVGVLTTDRSTALTGGAQDSVGAFSFKLASNTRADRLVQPLNSFWFDVDNTAIGSAKTATVEIISSGTLNNNDIRLTLQYMGTSGSTITSSVDSWTTVLTPATALPTSSAAWANPPGTPVKQYLQVPFTPQTAGRVRGRVSLGKVSATVWVNPQLTLA